MFEWTQGHLIIIRRFGSYPSIELVETLTNDGFVLFIDLTDDHDEILIKEAGLNYPYVVSSSIEIIKSPKTDRTPGDVEIVRKIVSKCVDVLQLSTGRSAVIAAIILIELGTANIDVLSFVNTAHSLRLVMCD